LGEYRLHRGEEVEMAVRECWEYRSPIFIGTEFPNSFVGGRSELAVESDDIAVQEMCYI